MTMLSVVIPAYNEEAGIAEMVHRVLAVEDSLTPYARLVGDVSRADRAVHIGPDGLVKTLGPWETILLTDSPSPRNR